MSTKEDFINKIKDDIEAANYDNATETGILQFIDDLVEKKMKGQEYGK